MVQKPDGSSPHQALRRDPTRSQDLQDWIEENRTLHHRLKRPYEQTHTTRMVPKRADEIVDGGSLYWVIRGQLACRQRLLASVPLPIRTESAAATSFSSLSSTQSSRARSGRSRAGATWQRRMRRGISVREAGRSGRCRKRFDASWRNSG